MNKFLINLTSNIFYVSHIHKILAKRPYFDTVRMSIIILMHNLYLETATNILKIWKKLVYLQKSNLEKLQEKVDEFVVPCDIGKRPKKL